MPLLCFRNLRESNFEMKDSSQIIHDELQTKFRTLLYEESNLKRVLFQILTEGTAYLIGGYVRDAIENRVSRDLDIVVDIPNEKLRKIVDAENCKKHFNRLGGAKLMLDSINVDIWSFDNNWAFKNKLVKLNEKEKLNSLAKGCFYNYDALVVNVSNFSYHIRYYENFVEKKELDILQKRVVYKNLNPTLEANILRAIFLKKKFGISYTGHLKDYLYQKMLSLNDVFGDAIERLMTVKETYPKYGIVNKEDIINTFGELRIDRPRSLFG